LADYFEEALKTKEAEQISSEKRAKEISNWLLGEVSRIMNATGSDVAQFSSRVNPDQLCRLITSIQSGTINAAMAKSVLDEMFNTGKSATAIISERGLSQISDSGALEAEVTKVIEGNAPAVADYRAGKAQSLKFLVGQVMKATKGRANPQVVNELLKRKLEE
jgi:aspartyl-tRNA(Asn)/glutamyl-tRNA(Gln) amidotransferase subunit B